jgi:hypothetical protein
MLIGPCGIAVIIKQCALYLRCSLPVSLTEACVVSSEQMTRQEQQQKYNTTNHIEKLGGAMAGG